MEIPNPFGICCCVPRTGAKIVSILNMVFQSFFIGFLFIAAKNLNLTEPRVNPLKLVIAMISLIAILFDLLVNVMLLCAVYESNIEGCKNWIYVERRVAAIRILQLILEVLSATRAELEAKEFKFNAKVIGTIFGILFLYCEILIVLTYIDQLQREQLAPVPEEPQASEEESQASEEESQASEEESQASEEESQASEEESQASEEEPPAPEAQAAFGESSGFVHPKPNPRPLAGGELYGFTKVPSLPGAAIYVIITPNEMISGPPPAYELVVGNRTGTGTPPV